MIKNESAKVCSVIMDFNTYTWKKIAMRERRMFRNVSWKFNDGGNSLRIYLKDK